MHKEEVSALKSRLAELNRDAKGASAGQKSGQREAEMLKKELEKTRKRCQDAEGKLRAAIQACSVSVASTRGTCHFGRRRGQQADYWRKLFLSWSPYSFSWASIPA